MKITLSELKQIIRQEVRNARLLRENPNVIPSNDNILLGASSLTTFGNDIINFIFNLRVKASKQNEMETYQQQLLRADLIMVLSSVFGKQGDFYGDLFTFLQPLYMKVNEYLKKTTDKNEKETGEKALENLENFMEVLENNPNFNMSRQAWDFIDGIREQVTTENGPVGTNRSKLLKVLDNLRENYSKRKYTSRF